MTQPSTPAPPPAPPPPPVADVTVDIPGSGVAGAPLPGVPQTAQELSALRRRRSELSDQLISASGRRDELAGELRRADGVNRAGLEQRLQVLDQRIVQLESDIAETGRQLSMAPAHLFASSSTAGADFGVGGLTNGQATGISIVGIIFIGFPLAIAMARRIWKRSVTPAPQLPSDATQRLQRMEQAVDAIAIEVERVSEGQRFLTRLFTDAGGAPALGAGPRAAEPVRAGDAGTAHVPRAGA